MRWPQSATRWLLAAIAVLPFYAVLACHFLCHPNPTGFIQYDQAYYVANGRAIFERGNGWAYPNAYDPDPQAPVIYVHWLPWLFGLSVKALGTDPVVAPLVLGLVGGIAYSWLTLRIIEHLLPNGRLVAPLFYLAMWGGGLLCLTGCIFPASQDTSLAERILAFDPQQGWWSLNWGRNLMYPTESVYHAIVAAGWLAILRGRENVALLCGGILAATHPFSGLQLLLFLGAWCVYRAATQRDGKAAARLSVWGLMSAVFAWYYAVYLPQFPQHVALQRHWTANGVVESLQFETFCLAYGPVAILACWRLSEARGPWTKDIVLFAACAAITFLLLTHDLFLSISIQPIHFAHGYEWMPLFLLGLPKLQQLLVGIWGRWATAGRIALMGSLFGLGTFDNLVFLTSNCINAKGHVRLSQPDREMFAWIAQEKLQGVLLCTNPTVSYLAAAYTPLRPYAGHPHNTPDFMQRAGRINAFLMAHDDPAWLSEIDYLLISPAAAEENPSTIPRWLPSHGWRLVREQRRAKLFARVR